MTPGPAAAAGRPLRVALIGNLVGVAYQLTRELRRHGVDAHLFLTAREAASRGENTSPEDFGVARADLDWVHVWDVPPGRPVAAPRSRRAERLGYLRATPRLWRALSRFDVVHALTLMPIFVADARPPFVVTPTGSDARETAPSRTVLGYFLRRAYRRAARVVTTALDAPTQQVLAGLGCLDKVVFVPWGMEQPEARATPIPQDLGEPLRYLHLSRWHFRVQSPGQAHKGSDRFLRAAAQVRAEGIPVRLTLIERGQDLEAARQLVTELGLDAVATWVPPLGRPELMALLRQHHVAADHFQYGIWGGACLEAMTSALPVLIYIAPAAEAMAYAESMPVLNVSTTEQIADAMRWAHHHRAALQQLGERARAFVDRYHAWDVVCARMTQVYRDVAAGLPPLPPTLAAGPLPDRDPAAGPRRSEGHAPGAVPGPTAATVPSGAPA